MENPCKNCHGRKWYAKRLDIHFWGEDCPYVCEEYEKWKKTQTKDADGEKKDEKS